MSADSTGQNEHDTRDLWERFRVWRGTRPFWAGLLTALGGAPIAYFPYANLKIGHLTLAMATTAGAGSLIIGVLLVTLGLTMWYHQIVRVFAGVASILLALVSIPVSNLGGFLFGFLLAMVGGCLALSWAPGKPVAEQPAESAAGHSPNGPEGPEGAAGPDGAGQQYGSAGTYSPGPAPWAGDSTIGKVDAGGGRNSAG
ncbi:DUF6114 domain-containing protein [Streptomyces sp. LN785]|uniref:DUF6114 domain-containing protein n=1 Tax=Streptomyces sp. LN785 TaxID=3112983 RepID=UPI00371037A9